MKRRTFLQSLGIVGFGTLLPLDILKSREQAVRLSEKSEDVLRSLVEKAHSLGAEYADARFIHQINQSLQVRKDVLTSANENDTTGIALRVYQNGNWGFVAESDPASIDVKAVAASACNQARALGSFQKIPFIPDGRAKNMNLEWSSPVKIDPFGISLQEKIEFLFSLTEPSRKKSDKHLSVANLFLQKREVIFYSSDGSDIRQTFTSIYPNFAYSLPNEKTQSYDTVTSSLEPLNAGYEVVKDRNFSKECEDVLEKLEQKKLAVSVVSSAYEVVFAPTAFWRIIYDTLCPILDPYMITGYSGSRPGMQFIPVSEIGTKQIGSPSFSVDFDNTINGGLSTSAYDDSGRISSKGTLINNGILTAVPGSDELAFEKALCSILITKAFTWKSVPHFAMPNLVVRGKENGASLDDLVSGVKKGILFSGRGTNLLTPDKRMIRIAPQLAFMIEKGKIADMVKDCELEIPTDAFWSNITDVGGATHAFSGADFHPSNDNPLWEHPFSIITPPVRVKSVPVFDAKGRKDK